MTQDEPTNRLVGSDAWLLLAILYAKGPTDRAEIVEIGDFIQHAILTDEELEGGLRRLKRAGHVLEDNGHFCASPAAAAWFEKGRSGRTHVSTDQVWVEGYLSVRS